MRSIALIAALPCGIFPLCAAAQVAPVTGVETVPPAVTEPEATVTPAAADPAPCADCVTIPALTPVRVEILVELGSKISKTGDTFPIRLAEPIVIDGRVIVPAGATGMGEVVHAKKSGGSGVPGELVLAARYVEVGDRRLRLRSLRMSVTGRSNIDTVNTINIASAASPLPVGMFGFLINGKQANVPQGSVADAKTAEAFTIAAPALAPAPPEAQLAARKDENHQ